MADVVSEAGAELALSTAPGARTRWRLRMPEVLQAPPSHRAAIRSAALGHSPLDPRVAGALLPGAQVALPAPSAAAAAAAAAAAQDVAGSARTSPLSARESEMLGLVTRGLSNKQIGQELGIAERTVKAHIGSIFRHLGVDDRASAAMWARDHDF
ncbi:hypothetical protein B7R22_06425 [Subtercola boreus]|uniref:HTH luxR-type domain-containing protein n=1 Tax=Subtercola boreus TaxID=120213 RepID=A0A3E0W252_9MICO|nr:response regulator transcription factor [Subtercola boreus]RFA15583.1 hypothetical protein B7R22_06425 [Subtercola boreus]